MEEVFTQRLEDQLQSSCRSGQASGEVVSVCPSQTGTTDLFLWILLLLLTCPGFHKRADPNVENKDKKVYRTIIVKMCSASFYLHASHLRLVIVDLLSFLNGKHSGNNFFVFVFYPGETVWQDYCGLSDLVCITPFLGSDSKKKKAKSKNPKFFFSVL